MAHRHHCQCQHERVEFCAKCTVVHCLDCKTEWVTPCALSHYSPWYWGQLTTPNIYPTWTAGASASPPSIGGDYTITVDAPLNPADSPRCMH